MNMHRRLRESGSIDVELQEESLPDIRAQLDQYNAADIYNMDEPACSTDCRTIHLFQHTI